MIKNLKYVSQNSSYIRIDYREWGWVGVQRDINLEFSKNEESHQFWYLESPSSAITAKF